MSKILRPYEVPLDEDLAKEVLNIPVEDTGDAPKPRTIGERIAAATLAVQEANEYLATSSLAAIIADTLMRRLKKRGVPSIRVRYDGTVILHVSYDEDAERPERSIPVERQTRSMKSDLPKLDELREMAAKAGIDISDLGQKRRAIYERLQEAEPPEQRPPARLVDEVKETEAGDTTRPKTPRRRRGGEPALGVVEELDMDDLLGS